MLVILNLSRRIIIIQALTRHLTRLLGILLSLLILFFLDWLRHGLSMLHVGMLLLHDLIHKNGLVDSFRSIEARCAPSVPLNFVLVAQRNRTANKNIR